MQFADLLERVAARTPAPGGGAGSGLACSLAAALVEMAARFAGSDPAAGEVAARAVDLRDRALTLANDDLRSYLPVLQALRRPRADPERAGAVTAALSAAAATPLTIARIGAELAGLAGDIAASGSRHLVGDAVTGALLAEAACRAAVVLVQLNLAGTDDERLTEASELVEAAGAARERALAVACRG